MFPNLRGQKPKSAVCLLSGVRIVPGGPGSNGTWKSYSLQRGTAAPTSETAIYASTNGSGDGTVVIRNRSVNGTGAGTQYADDEDPYGRCMNMKLTSFADSNARDPRIIDLNSSQNGLNQMSPRTGSPVSVNTSVTPQPPPQNFNTLPAHVSKIVSVIVSSYVVKVSSNSSTSHIVGK